MIEPLPGGAAPDPSPSSAAPVWEPSPEDVASATPESPQAKPDENLVPPPASSAPAAAAAGARPPSVSARLKGRGGRQRSVPALLSITAIVAVAGLCFAGGRVTAPTQAGSAVDQNGAFGGFPGANASGSLGAFGGGAAFGGSASVTGTVVSVTDSSMTLQLADGQTVQIATGSSTTYHNQTAGTSASVAAGNTVQVQVSGGSAGAGASASASAGAGTRTATDVTVTG